MFRKSNGKRGISLTNMFGDLPGSLSSSSGADPGHVSAAQQDSVYLYQLQLSNPCALNEETLHVAKIIDHGSTSKNIYQRLQKLDLIQANGEVVTSAFDKPAFGKEFTHSLAMIPVSRQKQVVDFLFWWEGETMRLRKLLEEKAELEMLKTGAQDGPHKDKLQSLLDRVQLKISARPSERVAEMEDDKDLVDLEAEGTGIGAGTGHVDEGLPVYTRS